ncbi:isoaspartyl peptidase/L-asparaginase [Haladaptatus sp. DYSN1]|uniref:isoaspartyl peptidase/L-asparaginase n=1 Tax=unclassified Haladaptatus TaxID=2622732 RepID=UPI0024060D6F|nr:isoaspartyl peptidase/L-asparaginase [Haladaptatus sp. DYSN1]
MHVIVHGGAGSAPDEPELRQQVLDEAADAGVATADPVSAVVAAINVLESSSRFNAGVGGAVQSDGIVRTDAGIMTDEYEAGAAAAMPGVEHAVDVARVVMAETPHVLVSGVHAVDLADAFDIETDVDLWTENSRKRWDTLEAVPEHTDLRGQLDWITDKFGEGSGAEIEPNQWDHDTVGAVAVHEGRVATATSTGGRWLALAGRVGDVPQIGSGFYVTPAGGASATGAGEDIAKVTLTRRAVQLLEAGHEPQEAANSAIDELAEATASEAGIIVLDADGNAGSAFNTEAMQVSRASK